jgi:hypothetical protein
MGAPLTHTQTEPALAPPTGEFEAIRSTPTSQSSTDTIRSSPSSQAPVAQYEQHLSVEPTEGEELARTTTSSSGFSTQSGEGGVESGSKRDKEWRKHFDIQEGEELVDSQYIRA